MEPVFRYERLVGAIDFPGQPLAPIQTNEHAMSIIASDSVT